MSDEEKQYDSGELTDDQKASRMQNAEMRKLRESIARQTDEIEVLKSQLTEKQWGMDNDTDPRIRGLVVQLQQTREELAAVSRIALRRPDDEVLEPYMQRVLDEHGSKLERAYPNRIERLEVVRSMARGVRVAEEEDTKSTNTGPRTRATPARVHLAGGGPSASRSTRADANDWNEFQAKMRDPKLSTEEKFALAQKYESEHPEES